jgi:molybdopterin-guanine dinucleotide biosynthesis protein A
MGVDKAALPFGSESLLQRVVRLVSPEVDEVWLVAREGQQLPALAGAPLPVARDPAEGLGPLAGVVAGLRAMRSERAFVISCDSPLLEPRLVRHLLDLSRGHRAAMPRVAGYWVPTTAVYAKSILPEAEALLARGELRPRMLVEAAGVRAVSEDELRGVDAELASLRDCDTPEDYAALLARAGLPLAADVSRMLAGSSRAREEE